jgi:hypothetical protein
MTTAIIISENNRARIETAIAKAQGKAQCRLIEFDDIVKACRTIEKELGITRKALEGISYNVDLHAQNFPNAYKYRAESTQFTLTFEKGKWRLVRVFRGYTKRNGHCHECVSLPD